MQRTESDFFDANSVLEILYSYGNKADNTALKPVTEVLNPSRPGVEEDAGEEDESEDDAGEKDVLKYCWTAK